MAFFIVHSALPANDVWVDFTSDFHNGSNGAPDGVADWINELNEATAGAGVPSFNATERAMIESNIMADLNTIYADYNLNFVLTEPAGVHDVMYMARDDEHPEVSGTNRGSAPIDIGNQDTNGYTDMNGNPPGVPRVTPANFDSHLESSDSRATQIAEISTALAGTAAHELGHSFGLLHHFVYSHPGITPTNYADTNSLQNEYLLGTASTGISEGERETLRSLSPFSQVMMDITGGSAASPSEENNSLVTGGIVSDRFERISGDAGSTPITAQTLSFSLGPTSARDISFVEADLDGSSSDVDVYAFTVAREATLVAQVFSERLDLGTREFDPVLELLDSSGSVLSSVDDIAWDDDEYGDFISPETGDDDPFLVNLTLAPDTYYLRVFAATTDVSDSPNVGDNYWLVTSLLMSAQPDFPDYNTNGVVDEADYTLWLASLGQTGTGLAADGDGNGVVDLDDYKLWKASYGMTLPTATNVPIPETTSITIVICLLGCICSCWIFGRVR